MTLLVVACAPTGGQVTTTSTVAESTTLPPPTTTTVTTTTPSTTTTLDRGDLADWEVVTVVVGGGELAVALADDPGERARGLMGVEDLGVLAGMLFSYDEDTQSSFWMKDTVLSLYIAFFAGDGSLVDAFLMEPCEADLCPLYSALGPYRWALETPAGDLGDLPADTTLVFP